LRRRGHAATVRGVTAEWCDREATGIHPTLPVGLAMLGPALASLEYLWLTALLLRLRWTLTRPIEMERRAAILTAAGHTGGVNRHE
jgi:hypothetical protein